jgi:hypothetical protein
MEMRRREEEERNENDYEVLLMFVAVIRISQPTYGRKEVYFLANNISLTRILQETKNAQLFLDSE